jgi:intracellular septation protein
MKLSPGAHKTVRAIVDFGGVAGLLVGYLITRNLVTATWGLLAGSLLGLAVGYAAERRIAPMPLVASIFALIFGTLTLVLQDPRFLMIKVTVVNLLFATTLLAALPLKKLPLKFLLGEALPLPDEAWRKLSLRYGLYFLLVAGLNEIIWRTQSEAFWLQFRTYGLWIGALLFSLTQVPLMMKHAKVKEPPPPPVD